MNKNIKSVIVLSAICLVVTALLATVNYITAPVIEKNALLKEQESLRIVLPEAEEFEEISLSEKPETVTGIYREINDKGYVITLETVSSYSQNPMTFTLGITLDGKISGVEITNYSETKNFGDYPEGFVGKDSALEGVDVAAGVTYSSEAFKGAVKDAFSVFEEVSAK